MKLDEVLKELSKGTCYSDIENHMIDGNWLKQELLGSALEIINHKNNMLKKDLESENSRLRKKIKSNNYLVKELLSNLIEDENYKEKALEVKTKLGIKLNKSAVLEIKTELTHEVLESLKNNIDAKDLVISYRGLNISADNVNVRGVDKEEKLSFEKWLKVEDLYSFYYESYGSTIFSKLYDYIQRKYKEYLNS